MTMRSTHSERWWRAGTCRAHPLSFRSVLVGLLLGAPVSELSAAEPTGADALFDAGRKLMQAGRLDEACPRFEESNRIDPATGTLLNLAVCNQRRGKTATAWKQFHAVEVLAAKDGRDDRVAFAREQRGKLAATLAYLTLVVPAAGRPLALQVHVEGLPVDPARWNVATPVDPGTYGVLAAAPGVGERSFSVRVAPSEVSSVVIDLGLRATGAEGVVETRSEQGAVGGPAGSDAATSPLRTWAFVAGGVGAAALVAGGYFGARAFSEWDARNRECNMDTCVSEAGKRAQRSAETAARNANISVTVGLAGVAAGVGLYLVSHRDEQEVEPRAWSWAPHVAHDQLGLVAEGCW